MKTHKSTLDKFAFAAEIYSLTHCLCFVLLLQNTTGWEFIQKIHLSLRILKPEKFKGKGPLYGEGPLVSSPGEGCEGKQGREGRASLILLSVTHCHDNGINLFI